MMYPIVSDPCLEPYPGLDVERPSHSPVRGRGRGRPRGRGGPSPSRDVHGHSWDRPGPGYENERPQDLSQAPQRPLLSRLSESDNARSLRDRVQVPLKRDRQEMMDQRLLDADDPMGQSYEGDDDHPDSAKRFRRKGPKPRPRRGKPSTRP